MDAAIGMIEVEGVAGAVVAQVGAPTEGRPGPPDGDDLILPIIRPGKYYLKRIGIRRGSHVAILIPNLGTTPLLDVIPPRIVKDKLVRLLRRSGSIRHTRGISSRRLERLRQCRSDRGNVRRATRIRRRSRNPSDARKIGARRNRRALSAIDQPLRRRRAQTPPLRRALTTTRVLCGSRRRRLVEGLPSSRWLWRIGRLQQS